MRHAIYHFDTCQFVLPKMERMKDDVQIMRIQMGSLLIAYRNRRCARKKVKKMTRPNDKKEGCYEYIYVKGYLADRQMLKFEMAK